MARRRRAWPSPHQATLMVLLICHLQSAARASSTTDHSIRFHTIVSTDCSPYADWQSEVLIRSHYTSGTAGHLTRIASCSRPGYVYPKVWHPRMTLEVTPNYGRQKLANGEEDVYSPYNKPMGIGHWLTHGSGARLPGDTVVAMMDPDMIITQPLERSFVRNGTGEGMVRAGRPAGQFWPLGRDWFDGGGGNAWLGSADGCRSQGPAGSPSSCRAADASGDLYRQHYMVGAPLAMTAADWRRLCPLYGSYLLRIREDNKDWMQEMFAYILAAMHLGLRHAVTSEIQVYSMRPKVLGQAWHMVEGLDPQGASSKAALQHHYRPSVPTEGSTAPPVLHYCIKAEVKDRGVGSLDQFDKRQRFRDGRVPAGLPDCAAGPLKEYPYRNGRLLEVQRNTTEALKTRMGAFMLRAVASSVWEALQHYRLTACGDGDRGGGRRSSGMSFRSSSDDGNNMMMPRRHHHPVLGNRQRKRYSRREDDKRQL